MSIFKRKKYETFLEASGTSESSEITDSSGEYARGVWESRKLQKGQGSEMSRDLIRKHYWFSGRVQGVGFRYRACYIASSLGVTGWVRNEYDGSVSAELQGLVGEIDQIIQQLKQDRYIDITGMDRQNIPPDEQENGFHIRY